MQEANSGLKRQHTKLKITEQNDQSHIRFMLKTARIDITKLINIFELKPGLGAQSLKVILKSSKFEHETNILLIFFFCVVCIMVVCCL